MAAAAVDRAERERRKADLARRIGRKAERRARSRRQRDHGVWFGLGMFGLVGWAVAIPTLLGIAAGVWIDRCIGGPYSWTLMGLFLGVVIGCLNAWYWVRRESRRD
jgi:ATP synthase protein I